VDQCRGERLSVGSNCLVHKTGRHIPTSRYMLFSELIFHKVV